LWDLALVIAKRHLDCIWPLCLACEVVSLNYSHFEVARQSEAVVSILMFLA
jgi:hypothetical protein